MGMSHIYTGHRQAEKDSIRTIHRAVELGVTHFDSAEIYGPYKNEVLLGKALKDRRDQVVVTSKFGMVSHVGNAGPLDSSAANIRAAVEGSLARLDTDYIDLYYQHRVDKTVPIEEVIGTLKELIAEGKIRHIGLSEAGPDTIRRANAVHPITALQSEYSLWTRDGDDGTLELLKELRIGFVPYSPLGRGLLTGKIRSLDQLDKDDWRLSNPGSWTVRWRRTSVCWKRWKLSLKKQELRFPRSRWPGCLVKAMTGRRFLAPSVFPTSKKICSPWT